MANQDEPPSHDCSNPSSYRSFFRHSLPVLLVVFLAVGTLALSGSVTVPARAALLSPDQFTTGGYFRFRTSVNTQDPIVQQDGSTSLLRAEDSRDDRWESSMIRGTFYNESTLNFGRWGNINWAFRADQEATTNYLTHLANRANANDRQLGGNGFDFQDALDYDNVELREFYWDFKLTDSIDMRLGKQQLVWGKTDFFQAMDMVQGFNNQWRLFFAPVEQRRSPTWMATVDLEVPEWGGSLQFYVEPGWGRDFDEMGTNFDVEGGRWNPAPFRGINGHSPALFPKDPNHPESDPQDMTYGVRFNGTAFEDWISYSIAYLHTFQKEPVGNSRLDPWKKNPITTNPNFPVQVNMLYPEIDVVGASMNTYIRRINSVLTLEAAYKIDKKYNYGDHPQSVCPGRSGGNLATSPFTGADSARFGASPLGFGDATVNSLSDWDLALGGYCGIKEKDTLNLSFRLEKTNYLVERFLWSGRPGLWSFQVFDKWIMNHSENDEIVDFFSYYAEQDEHSVIATLLFNWSYMNGTINPQMVWGHDVSYGGGFVIPSVGVTYGNHWRFKLEADLWYEEGSSTSAFNVAPGDDPGDAADFIGPNNGVHLAGYFDNNNQLMFRATYLY